MPASKPVVGEPRHFHTKFKWQLEIDNIGRCQFNKCSELKVDAAKIEYHEGGTIAPYKEPGLLTFADLTIERAVVYDAELYRWFVDMARAAANSGQPSPQFKRGGYLIQYDRDNSPLRTWQLYETWPASFTAGSWDNGSNEMTMEAMTLAIGYFVLRSDNPGNGGLPSALQSVVRTLLDR